MFLSTVGCNGRQDGLSAADAGTGIADADDDALRVSDAGEILIPATGRFTGGATGEWKGLLIGSSVDPSTGNWWLRAVTLKSGGGFTGGNVLAVNGLNLNIRGAPRPGTFELTSPDFLSALMVVTLNDGQTQLTASKDNGGEAGLVVAGSMSLAVSAATPERGALRISGTLDVGLVNSDPRQQSPTANFHATF